jgi:glycosyltransferase involved in cell wall biosynthesis
LSIVPGKTVWECSFNGLGSRRRNDELAGHLGVINRPTVVYTGTFAPYQGLDLLIEAATLVHAKIPEVVFLLVGGTEFELPHLTRLAEQRGLTDALQLHPRRPRREVADYLSLADVLVLPRVTGENAPLKIYEYMKSGKPIVATDIPAHRAVLSDQMAILVRPEATGWAEGILQALQNTVHTKKLVEAAKNASKALRGKPLEKTLAEAYRFVKNQRLQATSRHA